MPLDLNVKILLVEDAPVMRKMEQKVLNSLGLNNIIEADNGLNAIEKLNSDSSIGLIISDWNMPDMDGYDLLLWVRKNARNKKIPFLMATGRGEKKEVAKAEDAGVSSFISKPFNAEELKIKIEEALGIRKSEKADLFERPQIIELPNGKIKLRMAHIQITDHLVLGVLKHLIENNEFKPKHFELETQCMSSWNPVAEALEKGTVEGACVLAPIAMDLFSYNVPLKLILYAHKNGSIAVRNKAGKEYKEPYPDFFKGKSFYIPHTLSIHNMLAHIFFKGIGLEPGYAGKAGSDLNFEVVPPVKMPEFLNGNEESCGYLVAEPLGTKAIAAGIAEQQFLSAELWPDHPCCVVTLQDELVKKYPDAVYELTELIVKSGKFISDKPGMAAQIAVDFLDPQKTLGLKVPLLKNVLTEPLGIKTNDLYPLKEDLDRIQKYMHYEMGVGNLIDINEFVDLRFADKVCGNPSKNSHSAEALKNSAETAKKLLNKISNSEKNTSSKTLLNMEGKYLTFNLNNQEFGIDILKIVEIIRLIPITRVPNADKSVKGVINLRGKVIPVIDVRKILDMVSAEYQKQSRIIVIDTKMGDYSEQLGILVDSVSEVKDIKASDIQEAPKLSETEDISYIMAIAKAENCNQILLDLEKLLFRKTNIKYVA
ncbi:MAG: response regulator [Ignavibacteria bacterium]|nr:response regulator [Ignavibacteria bacterium]